MALRLALQFGYPNPDLLLAEMSAEQFDEWTAFYLLEPWGEQRTEEMIAILCSIVANANRDPKKRSKPFTQADFMPKREWKPAKQKQSVEVMKQKLVAIAQSAKKGSTNGRK